MYYSERPMRKRIIEGACLYMCNLLHALHKGPGNGPSGALAGQWLPVRPPVAL